MTPIIKSTSPDIFEEFSIITGLGEDENGTYLVFDKSIFVPKDNNRLSDCGIIHVANYKIPVLYVKQVNEVVRHYICSVKPVRIGQHAILKVNAAKRRLNSHLQTAAVFIKKIVENLSPDYKAAKVNISLNSSYVQFYSKKQVDFLDIFHLERSLNRSLKSGLFFNERMKHKVCASSSEKVDDFNILERNLFSCDLYFTDLSMIFIKRFQKTNNNFKLIYEVL